VNNAVQILLALALVAAVLRPRERAPYLVAVAAAAFPVLDGLLLTPLVEAGHLAGPLWTHRSVTHSLVAGVAVVAVAAAVGHWKAGALGYAAHLVPDFLFGGVKLFLPFDATVYGVQGLPVWPADVAVGVASVAVLLALNRERASEFLG